MKRHFPRINGMQFLCDVIFWFPFFFFITPFAQASAPGTADKVSPRLALGDFDVEETGIPAEFESMLTGAVSILSIKNNVWLTFVDPCGPSTNRTTTMKATEKNTNRGIMEQE